VLLRGAARLELEGQGELTLAPLDWLNIPAGMRHRVTFTDPQLDSVWLAVFYRD
jgi:cupin 2 domain-containing protein